MGPNLPKFGKLNEDCNKQIAMYRISVNLENLRFWNKIYQNNMNYKNFEKINIKIEISIKQSISVPNFSQFNELQYLGPKLPKEYE